MHRSLALLILTSLPAFVALADTSPIPQNLLGVDYVTFNGGSFGNSLICLTEGCGGAFNVTINSGPNQDLSNSVAATVWCVDYQLSVTNESQYTAKLTAVGNIAVPVDDSVRYGNLTAVSSDGSSAGWSNTVTDPTGFDADSPNSAAYRYALAATLISQYGPDPEDLDGSSPINIAIQEAAWYVVYNSDYTPGDTWPPIDSGIAADSTCDAGSTVGSSAPTGAAATAYTCWVQWAEDNVSQADTSGWAVISGPADASGNILAPAMVNGYESYQTFLVRVVANPMPEPSYYALLGVSCLGLFVVSRRWRKV